MLPRFLVAVFGLGCFGLGCFGLVSCGGSSSETPPPLEPDLRRPANAEAPSTDRGSDADDQPEDDGTGQVDDPGAPPPPTWGSGQNAPPSRPYD